MTAAFDTLNAARRLEAAGMQRDQAETIVDVIRQGHGELVTTGDLSGHLSALEARLYRALWIQAAGIIVVLAAFGGIAIGFASVWSGQ